MAGNSGAIRAGKAYYELYADRDPLGKGLKSAETMVRGSIRGIAKQVIAIGATMAASTAAAIAAVAAPAAATKLFATMGTELTNIARRTGASAAALSTLGYAAKQTGSDLGGIGGLLTTIRDKTMEAARGSDQAQLAFYRLGINFLQLSTMKPEDQLRLIASRLSAIPNAAIRAAAATELLGSAEMLPTLNRLTELEARAKRLGLVMSTDDADAAKAFNESLTDLWESLKFFGETLGAKIAPLLKDWVDTATGIVAQSKDWIASNSSLVTSGATLWASLKMQWLKGTGYIMDLWDGMTGWIESKWIDATAAVTKAWAVVRYNIGSSIDWLTKTFVGDWSWSFDEMIRGVTGAAAAFKSIWEKTLTWFGKRSIEVAQIAGHLSKPAAKAAGRAIDKGRALLGLEDPELKTELAAIESRRVAAQKALQDRLGGGKAGRAEAIASLEAEIAQLTKTIEDKKNEARGGAPGARAGAFGALPGLGSAVMHVQGIGADDVRTGGGISKVFASLRQQQNPAALFAQQAYVLQQEELREQRRIRIAAEKKIGIVGL